MSSWKGKTRGGVLGYKIFILILKYFGLSFAYFLLYFVVAYFMIASFKAFRWIYRFYHETLGKNSLRSFACVYRNYYLFGQILIDKIVMLTGFHSTFTFDFEGEEYLRQMDKGGFLISAHIGNWEIAGHQLIRLEKRINIILFDAEHQRIKGYLSNVFKRNTNFIIIRDNYSHLLEIREALANGEIIVVQGDRYIDGNKTLMIDFMGKPAAFPVGPINMAAHFNVPVSYVFALKESRKHYHFYATPLKTFMFPPNRKLRDQFLGPAVEEYVRELEKIVRMYPLEWFNYYDFWKLPEPVAN